MKNKFVLFPILLGLCITSCAKSKSYEPKEYMLELEYQNDFRILQLTDTHLGDKDNTKLHYEFMDLTINESNPNFIVITGDVLTYASKGTAKDFFNWLESHKIPWTITFGNHDEQCWYSIDWLTGYLNNLNNKRIKDSSSYCYFIDKQDDNIKGNCNFAINLTSGSKIKEQLIMMDSNRYNYNRYYTGYDYFHQDQIDWYHNLVTETTNINGSLVPSLMFYHIPLPEVRDAWAAALKDKSLIMNPTGSIAQQNEEPCNPKFNSHFYDEIKAMKSTHGMYFGHDHINNYIVNYEGIHFGYGIKATDRVYHDKALLGGRIIIVHDDNSLDYEDHYHTYEEIM